MTDRKRAGRPPVLDDPVLLGTHYVERDALLALKELARVGGRTVSAEVRAAIRRHLTTPPEGDE